LIVEPSNHPTTSSVAGVYSVILTPIPDRAGILPDLVQHRCAKWCDLQRTPPVGFIEKSNSYVFPADLLTTLSAVRVCPGEPTPRRFLADFRSRKKHPISPRGTVGGTHNYLLVLPISACMP